MENILIILAISIPSLALITIIILKRKAISNLFRNKKKTIINTFLVYIKNIFDISTSHSFYSVVFPYTFYDSGDESKTKRLSYLSNVTNRFLKDNHLDKYFQIDRVTFDNGNTSDEEKKQRAKSHKKSWKFILYDVCIKAGFHLGSDFAKEDRVLIDEVEDKFIVTLPEPIIFTPVKISYNFENNSDNIYITQEQETKITKFIEEQLIIIATKEGILTKAKDSAEKLFTQLLSTKMKQLGIEKKVIFKYYPKNSKMTRNVKKKHTTSETNQEIESVFYLAAHLAWSDRHFDADEEEKILNYLGDTYNLSDKKIYSLINIFNQFTTTEIENHVNNSIDYLKNNLSREMKENVMRFLYDIITADGIITKREKMFFEEYCNALNVNLSDYIQESDLLTID
jgi:uncharacterized tellurite resistance protein B-like protein